MFHLRNAQIIIFESKYDDIQLLENNQIFTLYRTSDVIRNLLWEGRYIFLVKMYKTQFPTHKGMIGDLASRFKTITL